MNRLQLGGFGIGLALSVALATTAALGEVAVDIETLPESRGGQDLVGTAMPKLRFDRWIDSDNGEAPDSDGSVTLYRWWTDGCPFCRTSLPAIEKLRREYEPKGLRIVAVYHPKPPSPVRDEVIRAAAERIGYRGLIAVDQDWSELTRLYLSTGKRSATSASFLVDRDGTIRFVHPGTEFFPSERPDERQQDEDYRLLERAVRALLEPSDPT